MWGRSVHIKESVVHLYGFMHEMTVVSVLKDACTWAVSRQRHAWRCDLAMMIIQHLQTTTVRTSYWTGKKKPQPERRATDRPYERQTVRTTNRTTERTKDCVNDRTNEPTERTKDRAKDRANDRTDDRPTERTTDRTNNRQQSCCDDDELYKRCITQCNLTPSTAAIYKHGVSQAARKTAISTSTTTIMPVDKQRFAG